MRTAGIIAEFNPFHNGHESLVLAAKGAGFTHVAAVMSGNFVQRAAPAVTDKRVRTCAALNCGVDLVLELPLPFATAGARHFATGAVKLLAAMGCVDALCFGSEAGDTELLQKLSGLVDDPAVNSLMKKYLGEGITFAKARSMAVGDLHGHGLAEALTQPNNLLAVEYLRACKEIAWEPEIFTIPRLGVAHDSNTQNGRFASASYLRGQSHDLEALRPYVPQAAFQIYEKASTDGILPCAPEKLELAVLSRLRGLSPEALSRLPELSEGIEHRFYAAIRASGRLSELEQSVKTKRYTMARVRRMILRAFLGVTAADLEISPPYLRVLGFNGNGCELLSRMKYSASLPVSQSLARLRGLGGDCGRFAFLEEIATDQFGLALPKPLPCGYEYTAKVVHMQQIHAL